MQYRYQLIGKLNAIKLSRDFANTYTKFDA